MLPTRCRDVVRRRSCWKHHVRSSSLTNSPVGGTAGPCGGHPDATPSSPYQSDQHNSAHESADIAGIVNSQVNQEQRMPLLARSKSALLPKILLQRDTVDFFATSVFGWSES